MGQVENRVIKRVEYTVKLNILGNGVTCKLNCSNLINIDLVNMLADLATCIARCRNGENESKESCRWQVATWVVRIVIEYPILVHGLFNKLSTVLPLHLP